MLAEPLLPTLLLVAARIEGVRDDPTLEDQFDSETLDLSEHRHRLEAR